MARPGNRRLHEVGFATFLALLFVLIPFVANAQVVIRENVAITNDGSGFAKSLTTDDTLGVPSDGLLMIEYTSADMIFSDFESDATLHVTLNGLPFVDDTVTHHVGTADTTTYFCSSLPIEVRFGNRFTYSPPPDSAFVVGPVEEGDKIAFDYDGNKNASYYTENTGGSSWLGSQIPQGCQEGATFYPYELITFDAILIPDTLNLKFDPPADGNTYPEPGLEIEVTASVTDAGDNGHVLFEIENFDYPDTEFPDTLIYFLDGTDTTLTLDPVAVVDDTARATLITKDTWGQVIVIATYTPEVVSKTQDGPTNPQVKVKIWPEDDDFDGLADRWEEEDCGTLDLSTIREDITCTELNAITGGSGDWCWDQERSQGINNKLDGDGLTKLQEYQGVEIGSTRKRLDCNKKEVFVDISEVTAVGGDILTAVDWAVGQLESQLKLETFHSESISGLNIHGSTSRFPGSKPLKWRGRNRMERPTFNYIRMRAPLHRHSGSTLSDKQEVENGLVVAHPNYYWGNTAVENDADAMCSIVDEYSGNRGCQPANSRGGTLFGRTSYHLHPDSAYAIPRVYRGTIANLFDAQTNYIDESQLNHTFYHIVAVPEYDRVGVRDAYLTYQAHFDEADADFSGEIGSANPFDVLGNPLYTWQPTLLQNDLQPGTVAGMSELDVLKMTSLHELGHAVGVWNEMLDESFRWVCDYEEGAIAAGVTYKDGEVENCHPKFYESVMRQGIGPAKIPVFENWDIALMRIKRRPLP